MQVIKLAAVREAIATRLRRARVVGVLDPRLGWHWSVRVNGSEVARVFGELDDAERLAAKFEAAEDRAA